MTVIDNTNQTLQGALANALTSADKVDIATGFFYFSGFQALVRELKDKKLRILVGLEVDPELISQISQYAKEGDEDLTRWQPRRQTTSRTVLRDNYMKSLVGVVNDSDIFDSEDSVDAYDIYREKIENGTLEIRKTIVDNHAKLYLVHNKPEDSQKGDFPGTVFMGSSNFTYKGLVGQGELNDSSREKQKFTEYQKVFEDLWSDSKSVTIVDKHTKDEFLETLNQKLWRHATPMPYEIYIRVLHELFAQEKEGGLLTPAKITKGLYSDLEYQIDAVRMAIDKIKK